MRRQRTAAFGLAVSLAAAGCAPLPVPDPKAADARSLGRSLPRAMSLLPEDVLAFMWSSEPAHLVEAVGLGQLFAALPLRRAEVAVASLRRLGVDLGDLDGLRDLGVDANGEVAVALLEPELLGVVLTLRDAPRFERACAEFHVRSNRSSPVVSLGDARVYGADELAVAVRERAALLTVGRGAHLAAGLLSRAAGRLRLADSSRALALFEAVRVEGTSAKARPAPRASVGFFAGRRALALLLDPPDGEVVGDLTAAQRRLEARHADDLLAMRRAAASPEEILRRDARHRDRLALLRPIDEATPREILASTVEAIGGTLAFDGGGGATPSSRVTLVGHAVLAPEPWPALDAALLRRVFEQDRLDPLKLLEGKLGVDANGVAVRAVDVGALALAMTLSPQEQAGGTSEPRSPSSKEPAVPPERAALEGELRDLQRELDVSLRAERDRRLAHRKARASGRVVLDARATREAGGVRFEGTLALARGGLLLALSDLAASVTGAIEEDPLIERTAKRHREVLERRRSELLDQLYRAPQPADASAGP
ncbi:MAG: hypothetical protein FJ096_10915 [Deltaproteobacteria bacterium]|nr:hypothetical protein [Deltaproteobacteria bacterium]